jgi:hypothetical protein
MAPIFQGIKMYLLPARIALRASNRRDFSLGCCALAKNRFFHIFLASRYIGQMSSQSIQKGSKASSQGYAAARSSSSALSIGRPALSMPGPRAGDGFFMFN